MRLKSGSDDQASQNPSPEAGGAPNGGDNGGVHVGMNIARRLFIRTLGYVGMGVLANQVSQGRLWDTITGKEEKNLQEISEETVQKIEVKAKEIAHEISKEPGLTEREKAMKVIDRMGCFLFAWGIKDLLPKMGDIPEGHGHIHAAHYGALGALTLIKYELSTPEEKHHLEEETISNLKAFGIISGTMVVAEGIQADIEYIYENWKGKKIDRKNKVALMNLVASLVSPFATTVGSACIMKKMSNDLAGDDQDFMAAATSHISNLSGFILFGDPPFIAIVEKYGFEEAIAWQMKTMWPLALYSLVSNTYKMNKYMALRDGLTPEEAKKQAKRDTITGLRNNVTTLVSIIGRSLENFFLRYYGTQTPKGLQFYVGETLIEKLNMALKLPFDQDLPAHHHEEHEGFVSGISPEERGGNEVIAGILKEIGDRKLENPVMEKIRHAIDNREYDDLKAVLEEYNIPKAEIFVNILRDFQDNKKIDNGHEIKAEDLLKKLSPIRMYQKSFDVGRIKDALGHNLGDVMNVFPFQAGCVPFLTPVFKDFIDSLEGMDETQKEVVIFLLLMAFSMFADNYVACKIGLELLPKKPQIPLIASIIGGSMSSIGNMANVAQFSLDKMPLLDSLKKVGLHADVVFVGLAWSQILGLLDKLDIKFFKAPVAAGASKVSPAEEVAKPSTPNNVKESTRRDFLRWKVEA